MNFEYKTFVPRTSTDSKLVNSTYNLFESVWSKTFQELDGVNDFYSDAFVYADHIGVIHYRGQPIAAHVINWHDLENPINFKLRSLTHYPSSIREKLAEQNVKTLCTMEYLCLTPEFRQNKIVHFPTLMGYLSIRTLRTTPHNMAITVTHNLRKVNKVCENLGMQKLLDIEHNLHNVPVDFYSLASDTPFVCIDPTVSALGEKLFLNWSMEQNVPAIAKENSTNHKFTYSNELTNKQTQAS